MVIIPGEIIRLWMNYQENGTLKTGLTDLVVLAKDFQENTILNNVSLTESGSGYYYYDWNTTGIALEKKVKVWYKKGTDILFSEEYEFDIIEDSDGIIL